MPVTVFKHDVLLPSLDLVLKWIGAPTVGAVVVNPHRTLN